MPTMYKCAKGDIVKVSNGDLYELVKVKKVNFTGMKIEDGRIYNNVPISSFECIVEKFVGIQPPHEAFKTLGFSLEEIFYHNYTRGDQNYSSFTSWILLNGERVGKLEDEGTGGHTVIKYMNTEKEEKCKELIMKYFKIINFNLSLTNGIEDYRVPYTFTHHLLNVTEMGEVSAKTMRLGILS